MSADVRVSRNRLRAAYVSVLRAYWASKAKRGKLRKLYTKFRAAGYDAKGAIRAARIEQEWARLEYAGLVWIEAEEDPDPYDFGDMLDGMSEREQAHARDSILANGVYGVIGSFRTRPRGQYHEADAIWGSAGYDDPCDPCENWYVTDIKAETIRALKDALRMRGRVCPNCKHIIK